MNAPEIPMDPMSFKQGKLKSENIWRNMMVNPVTWAKA